MINLQSKTPTGMWVELGRKFFSSEWRDFIDLKLGDRRFVSINNVLTIREWPKEWTGDSLFQAVGYSDKGTKMKKLRETYVDEDQLKNLEYALRNWKYSDCFRSIGMNFKMKQSGKGGCLSSFHLVRTKENWEIFVHAKIVELPRKFLGDLRLIGSLVHSINGGGNKELDPVIKYPFKVTFHLSTMYFSIVGLRAYTAFLEKEGMDLHDLPINEPRNYQASIIEAITEQAKVIKEEYGDLPLKQLNYQTGEWR